MNLQCMNVGPFISNTIRRTSRGVSVKNFRVMETTAVPIGVHVGYCNGRLLLMIGEGPAGQMVGGRGLVG